MYNIPKIKFTTLKNTDVEGSFEITPLLRGFADTIGSSLRRTLYSSTQGSAVTKVRIENVTHEFSTIEGLKEDVLEFSMNIKGLNFSKVNDEPVELELIADEVGEITGNNIIETSDVKVINKDHYLGTITKKGTSINAKLTIESGYGYSPITETTDKQLGVIELDANYSPIVNVVYKVEEERVGTESNYDKLRLDVTTNGSIKPEEAVKRAANLLQTFYSKVIAPDLASTTELVEQIEEEAETDAKLIAAKEVLIEDLSFPTRTINALKKANIRTLYDLVKTPQSELLSIRNLGERSYMEIERFKKEEGFV